MSKRKHTEDEANLSPLLGGDHTGSGTKSFQKLKIKVCGMKYPENVVNITALHPDFMGFIFYPKSKRYAEDIDDINLEAIPAKVKKIAVFVNETLGNILTIVYKYKFDGVQLHGFEMVDMCKRLRDVGLIVIKAFPVADAYNFRVTKAYEDVCDYFLFDTRTESYGGSGEKFDWSILHDYKGNTPFFLSGGIAPDDVKPILKIKHPAMIGIDLNSRFEIEPGLKDVDMLRRFMAQIH